MKRNEKGFSLVELIIVIAILAALVAIVAPQYFQYVRKSQTTVCRTNIEELSRMANTAYIADELPDKKAAFTKILSESGDDAVCPFCKKAYYVAGSYFTGEYLTCPEHGPGDLGNKDALTELQKLMKDILGNVSSADSGADLGNWTPLIKSALKTVGIDMDAVGAVSWRYDNTGKGGFYWSTKDISSLPAGTEVPVMRFDFKTGKYSVSTTQTAEIKYSSIKQGQKGSYMILSDTGSLKTAFANAQMYDYDEALKEYQKLVQNG